MADLNTVRMPVESADVLTRGAMLVSIEAARDFDRSGRGEFVQARDRDTGLDIWVATVVDLDQMYQPDVEPTGFRRTAEMKVRILSNSRPVVPAAMVPGFGPVVEFENLTLTPYTDTTKCTGPRDGRAHRCGARQAYSMRATGMRAFSGQVSTGS